MENVVAGFEHAVVLAAVVERAEGEEREVFTIGRTSGPGCAPYVASMTLSMLLGQPLSGLAATVTGNPTISWVILKYFFIQVVP